MWGYVDTLKVQHPAISFYYGCPMGNFADMIGKVVRNSKSRRRINQARNGQ
jgi:hypothetical protein